MSELQIQNITYKYMFLCFKELIIDPKIKLSTKSDREGAFYYRPYDRKARSHDCRVFNLFVKKIFSNILDNWPTEPTAYNDFGLKDVSIK